MPHIMEANKKQEIDILPKNWNHLFFEDYIEMNFSIILYKVCQNKLIDRCTNTYFRL